MEYKCNSCPYESKLKRYLTIHWKSMHEEKAPLLCDSCPYKTTNGTHLKKHREAIHLGIKYPCDSCKYQATDKSSLKRHQRTIHEGKKVIRSEVFDKDKFYAEVVAEFQKEQASMVDIDVDVDQATNKSNINRHQSTAHEGKKVKRTEVF